MSLPTHRAHWELPDDGAAARASPRRRYGFPVMQLPYAPGCLIQPIIDAEHDAYNSGDDEGTHVPDVNSDDDPDDPDGEGGEDAGGGDDDDW